MVKGSTCARVHVTRYSNNSKVISHETDNFYVRFECEERSCILDVWLHLLRSERSDCIYILIVTHDFIAIAPTLHPIFRPPSKF